MPIRQTYAGAKLAISTTVQNSNLDQTGFEALTFINVNGVGSTGDWQITDNIIDYPTVDDDVSQKQKGITNGGDPAVEFADDPTDPGQQAYAAASETRDNYAFRLTLSNGAVVYNRGVVANGGLTGGGGREDFIIRQYTQGHVQRNIEVSA